MPAQTVNGAILQSSTEAGAVWTDTTVNIGSPTGPVSFFALAYVPGTSSTVSVTGITINSLAMTLEADRSMLSDFGEQGRHRAARLDGASLSGALSVQVTKSSTIVGRPTILLCWSDQSTGVWNIAFVPTMSGSNVSATVTSNTNSQAALLGWFYSSVSITPSAPTVIPQHASTPAMAFLPGSTELRIGALAEPGATSSVLQATLSHLYTAASIGWVGSFAGTAGGDPTPPTLVGSITQGATTSSSIAITWPAGADNVAVTGYDVSRDGGATWVASNGGTATTTAHTFSGLAASTAYAIRVRAKDAAGNLSTPVLTASFSTSAAGDPTPPTLVGSITQGATTSSSIAVTWPAGADNVAVTGYDVSQDGGATWVASNGATATTTAHTFSGLAASTAYAIRVRAKDAAGNLSTPVLAASFSTNAAGGAFGFSAGPCYFASNTGPQLDKAVTWSLIYGEVGAYSGAPMVDGAGTLNASTGLLTAAGLAAAGAADLWIKDADGGRYYQRVTVA